MASLHRPSATCGNTKRLSETIYIRVDPELKRRVEEQLCDPVTKGLPYGALSLLCRRLLTEWVEQQEATSGRGGSKRPGPASRSSQ